jgi:hypothetical protein
MIKRVSIIILVSAILITGYISMRKLNFWERSVAVFKMNSSGQSFGLRGGRGPGEFRNGPETGRSPEFRDGRQRPDRMNIPDSLRAGNEGRAQRFERRERPGAGSLSTGRTERDTIFALRGPIDGRIRNENGYHRREGRGGSPVSLTNVLYFLAVFVFFTTVVIYLDKAICLIILRKNKLQDETCPENEIT